MTAPGRGADTPEGEGAAAAPRATRITGLHDVSRLGARGPAGDPAPGPRPPRGRHGRAAADDRGARPGRGSVGAAGEPRTASNSCHTAPHYPPSPHRSTPRSWRGRRRSGGARRRPRRPGASGGTPRPRRGRARPSGASPRWTRRAARAPPRSPRRSARRRRRRPRATRPRAARARAPRSARRTSGSLGRATAERVSAAGGAGRVRDPSSRLQRAAPLSQLL